MKFRLDPDSAAFVVDCLTIVVFIGTEYGPEDEYYEKDEEMFEIMKIIHKGRDTDKGFYVFEIPENLKDSFYQALSYGVDFYGLHKRRVGGKRILSEIAKGIEDDDMVSILLKEL